MSARRSLLAPFSREALLQRVHEVDDIRGTLRPRHLDLLALGLLIDDLAQRRLVAVLELVRFEVAGLGLYDVLCEIEHLLLDFDVGYVLKIVRLVPDLVGVAQERAHQPFPARLQRDHVLARGQHETAKRDFAGGRYRLSNGDERIGSDLTLRAMK